MLSIQNKFSTTALYSAFNNSLSKIIIALMLLLETAVMAQTQQKTVEGTLQILPPYPTYWVGYTNGAADKLRLTLTVSGYWESAPTPIKLRVVLEKGNSIIAQSDGLGALTGTTLMTLTPNIPYTLSAAEIAPYFQLNNLQGITQAAYNQPLTEGVYRLTFYVYNANTSKLISDGISQQFWVIENEPPLLNAPRTGDNIKNELNAPINFQWVPRAIQAAARTEYELTLVEISAGNADNPYAQFLSKEKTPLFKRLVGVPALSITPVELGLIAGRTYAWRVKARLVDVLNNEIGGFKNNGYSDIFTFRYASSCVRPTGLKLEAQSGDRVAVNWTSNIKHLSYRVAYRKYSTDQNWKWLEQASSTNYTQLTELEPNTEYQVTVGGLCAENFLSYSDTLRIKTLDQGAIKGVVCGQLITPDLSNKAPLAYLAIGDSIKAGDFTVVITRILGGNGNFTGQGYVKVPWMGDTKFKVKFNGISVNTDRKLIAGVIETAYDSNWKNIASVDEIIQEIKAFFDLVQDLIDAAIENSRINDIVEQLKNQIESNLPPELASIINAALQDMKDAKAAYDASKKLYESLPPGDDKDKALQDMEIAKAKFEQAKITLKEAQNMKSQFVLDAAKIIRLALKSILEDHISQKPASDTQLAQSTTNLNQIFPATNLKPISDLATIDGVLISQNVSPLDDDASLSQADKAIIKSYLKNEYTSNRLEVSKQFATAVDTDEGAIKLANELKKDGADLGKYIYEKKKQNVPESTLVAEVKELLYINIENILITKIYKQ